MGKISGLTLHNIKKEKGQYISFGIVILITAFILNPALVLNFQVDKAYDNKFDKLNTANVNFCIPAVQDTDTLMNECMNIKGAEEIESHEGILTDAVIEEFRGVDFSIRTIFYNMDDVRNLNRFEVNEKGEEQNNSIYIPLYVAQFGNYDIGDSITYKIDSEDYTFQIAGIVREMQYGNAGTGLMGAYLPNETYNNFANKIEENKVKEYSIVTEQEADIEDVTNAVNSLLSEKNINLLSITDGATTKQVRTMVCNIIIVILTAFSLVILIVSMLLCKFRIQNTMEEEIINMGVLKAVGYTGSLIICVTILPYIIVGAASALTGVAASYVLLPVLTEMLALQSGFVFSLHFDMVALCITFIVLMGITILFTYTAAARIRRLKPVNAIRGNSENSHNANNHFPLERMPGNLQINLIIRQTASMVKQNVLLLVVTFLIMVLIAFVGTLFYNVVIEPDNFTSTLSEETPDVVFNITSDSKNRIKDILEKDSQTEKVLEYDTAVVETKNGSITAFICENFSNVTNDLCYRGRNPVDKNEIAVGSALEDEYSIGDKIEIKYGDGTYLYEIVGFIQSVNYQGEVCELIQEGYLNINSKYKCQSIYLYLKDNVDVERYITETEKKNPTDIVNSVNFNKMTKVSQDMYSGTVKVIIVSVLILTILIVFLVLYIIIKSLIISRKQEFGIYKAIGYSNIQLIFQIAGSLLPVSLIAVLTSAIAGLWYIPIINTTIFSTIGAMKNNLSTPLSFLLLSALIQLLINLTLTILLSLPLKKITPYTLIKE
ncbi:MAG: ABC transporter permease [Lachnospiraceae bacterium]|nr:ABC transporter permease [Lachnospiraceae bacterium]